MDDQKVLKAAYAMLAAAKSAVRTLSEANIFPVVGSNLNHHAYNLQEALGEQKPQPELPTYEQLEEIVRSTQGRLKQFNDLAERAKALDTKSSGYVGLIEKMAKIHMELEGLAPSNLT
jgi:hypothetical protein|tara:strand:- start:513 stop:866 length:354 start_codon:yes stop_codon:yes gene_type:complete